MNARLVGIVMLLLASTCPLARARVVHAEATTNPAVEAFVARWLDGHGVSSGESSSAVVAAVQTYAGCTLTSSKGEATQITGNRKIVAFQACVTIRSITTIEAVAWATDKKGRMKCLQRATMSIYDDVLRWTSHACNFPDIQV
jgi:hypothetical protein